MKSKSIGKKMQIAFWVLVILAALCTMLFMVIYSNKGIHIFSSVTTENTSGPLNIVGTYQVDNTDINEVSIDWGWGDGDVTVSAYDGDEIVINEFAYHELEENEQVSWEVKSGKLVLKYMKSEPQSDNLFFNNVKIPVKQLEIKIPSSLASSMDSISIDVTSSNVSVNEINAKQFTVTNTDGDIELSNISAKRIRLDNTDGNTTIASSKTGDISIINCSGFVNIRETSADSLELETEEGEAMIDTVTLGTFSCEADTADITMKGSCDKIDVESIDGNIDIRDDLLPESLDIDTDTGNVVVSIPTESLPLIYETDSGKFSSELPIIESDGKSKYRIETIEGDIRIKGL